MNIKHYIVGEIENFPEALVLFMLSKEKLGDMDKSLKNFQEKRVNCFTWGETPEGHAFWYNVITRRRFELFFNEFL